MFANNVENNEDIESMPQLKFKVPNFIGTLTERKRPVFAEALNSEEPSIPDQRPQHPEQQRYERPVAELQLSQVKPPVSSATMKPTDLFMQARSSNGQAQNMKPIDSFATHQKIDQEVSLKKTPLESTQAPQFHGQEQQQLFANGSEMRDLDSTPQMNHGAHHPYNQMALIVDPPPNTKRINEESSLLDHRSSNYSKEADHYLNQIVTTLAHFRSLGKRSADVAAQLETQLFIEKDNCGQQRALLDLERQAKLMVQEELQSAREVISQLTEKLNKIHQEKLQLERSRIEDENERWQLKKELDSISIEKELSKNELEHLHANLQDLERSLVTISEERTLLNTELSMQRASMLEQEGKMRVEIEKGIENYAEQQESFDKYRKSSQCQLEALERKNNELILLTESFGLLCKDACLALGLEYVEDKPLKDYAHSVLETIKTLTRQKSEADASTSRLVEELKSSIEQKQHALDHLQARQRDFEETMRISEVKNCEIVAELERKNRELQAANESMMTEAMSLRNTKASLEEYGKFYAEIKSKLTNAGEANSPQQILEMIDNLKVHTETTVDAKVVEELQNTLKMQQDVLKAEKSAWETERHRLVAERLKLIQENESLRRELGPRAEPKTPVNQGRSSLSGETTTESIMRAIEADLKKAKSGNKQSLPDDSWTVSDSTIKSPLKRITSASRPSSKKKRMPLNNNSMVRESPLKAQGGNSELDFWAFAK